ncbi:MAG: hypothetical protein GVY15_13925 [Bacteroidetes bacterium]|jgi:uncharacterized membrane protein|nr:hypothetical protein [Bacteroidota bacterium]
MPVIEKEVRIKAPVERVFDFWQQFERFDELLSAVKSIESRGENKSRWIVRAPFNTTVEFVAETQEEVQNEYIRWASEHGAGPDTVTSGGEIFFKPIDKNTATHVLLRFEYEVPSEAAERVIATLSALGYPERDFDDNLEEIRHHVEG